MLRKGLIFFEGATITAKFHYLLHYAQLVFYFGPLIKVWTLRFEQKHQYFKRCFAKKRNYINPTKTIAEHAQLAEAYFLSGSENAEEIGLQGHVKPYLSVNIESEADSLIRQHFQDTMHISTASNVTFEGIHYRLGQLLYFDKEDENKPEMGEIRHIIIHHETITKIYFILALNFYEKDENIGVFNAVEGNEVITLTSLENLSDRFPLEKYLHNEEIYFASK